jgi:squalene-hopene/tetraprenyl-beta-curcumene cyclase
MSKRGLLAVLAVVGAAGVVAVAEGQPAAPSKADPRAPLAEAAAKKAQQVRAKAIAFLRSKQDAKIGAWGVKDGVAGFPGYTGLVVAGMLLEPGVTEEDPAVMAGVKYILSVQKEDGGFYTAALPTYNTAICLSAISGVKLPAAQDAKVRAAAFLKKLQFCESAGKIAGVDESPSAVAKDHAFYGGWGYGRHGRPDLSNTQWVLEGLHDAGVSPDDAAFQRALVFLQRCQMVDKVNDMSYADGTNQKGFIYATSENKDKVGVGQSMAGTVEETLSDGTRASKLRAYGSMTYAGFKSYVYAGLKKDDERVKLAMEWIRENYTLAENPGMGTEGFYYYVVTFARALEASGETALQTKDGTRDWRVDLIDRLAELQNEDGSFKPFKDRWLENDPVLITAYSLLAAEHAK